MTWVERHIESERFASDAEAATRRGESSAAMELYAKAADAEGKALQGVDANSTRTLGIIAVSAVALRYKAMQLDEASILAHRCLGSSHLPDFAREQLQHLLETMKWQRALSEMHHAQMIVSLSGGTIMHGGAPSDLVTSKIRKITTVFYRTVEHWKQLPHRRRGEPSKEIRDAYRPWTFQAAPGSYRFAMSVQPTRQLPLESNELTPKDIVDGAYDILQACAGSPEGMLSEMVPDVDYRLTFLKLTRDLVPNGKQFNRLTIAVSDSPAPLVLMPDTKYAISGAIQALSSTVAAEGEDVLIRGVLRALHLDRDWIEVVDENGENQTINNVGEEVDDRLGSMVNGSVVVHASRVDGKLMFRDIEPDE
ncbi:MAG: hypothetical protein OXF79_21025 [Chloroflexi bacterium]|nr:hypothetical protein [Chloroflexota bacterium]